MTPEQMEELAKWHDGKAIQCEVEAGIYADAETKAYWTSEEGNHHKSASIIRWAAKVLEAEPVADIELKYSNRYRVEDHKSGFWPSCVVCGDGEQKLYIGNKSACLIVARRLQQAFYDGIFVASELHKPTFGDDK